MVLYVSRAKASATVKVPKVIGYSLESATEKLTALGFEITTEETDSEEAPGTVLDQTLANEYSQKRRNH